MNIFQKINTAVKILIDQKIPPFKLKLNQEDYKELCLMSEMNDIHKVDSNGTELSIGFTEFGDERSLLLTAADAPFDLEALANGSLNDKERTCVITFTPDNSKKQIDIDKGAVSTYEIANLTQAVLQLLSKMLVDEYIELTGDAEVNPEKFEEWITFLRQNKV